MKSAIGFVYCVFFDQMCFLASSFDSPFHEHGAIQADRSEWANLVAEAQQNDQQWLKEQLERKESEDIAAIHRFCGIAFRKTSFQRFARFRLVGQSISFCGSVM